MLDLIIKNGLCYINGKLEDKDIGVKDDNKDWSNIRGGKRSL